MRRRGYPAEFRYKVLVLVEAGRSTAMWRSQMVGVPIKQSLLAYDC